MSDDFDFRFNIEPVPTADEADAVVAAMLLHLNRPVAGEAKPIETGSRWVMAGRLRSHASRHPRRGIPQERINAS